MKQLTLLLFSLIFSFNSYGQWLWSTVDVNGDKHYLDITAIEEDEDGYFYYWEMINYTNPTDKYLSIATYRVADCDEYRTKDLTFDGYFQEMAEGEPETIDLTMIGEDWKYLDKNSYAGFNLLFICKNENDYYDEWYEVSAHVDGSTTFYMDPDSIKKKDGYISFWTLIDYAEDSSDNIRSQIIKRHVDCEEGELRSESVYGYAGNMGEGDITIPDEVTLSEWTKPPLGSNFDGYIVFGCEINKLSDEEREELKIEWKAEMEETL
tara:strand:- start:16 stop:810 length:795 start_codon:yes stop_codon:yes gene_type:complete